METALSTINQLPSTKKQIDTFVDKVETEVLSRYDDPLEFAIKLRCIEDIIKRLRSSKKISDLILNQAEKYGKEIIKRNEAELQVKETGVKYDFKNCNDHKWNQLNKNLENIKLEIKKREEILKIHKDQWSDIETGEIINPPVKTSTTKVIVTLK